MANVTQKSFDEFRKVLSGKLDSIIATQTELNNKLDGITSEIASLRTEAADRDVRLNNFEKTIDEYVDKYQALEKQLLLIDVKDRRLNLIVHGLPAEEPNKKVEDSVIKLVSEKLGVTSDISMTKCYRISSRAANITNRRSKQNSRRKESPVFISLSSESDVQSIMNNVKKLKGSGIIISTDLPPALNMIRNSLLSKAQEMKESKHIVSSRVRHKGINL